MSEIRADDVAAAMRRLRRAAEAAPPRVVVLVPLPRLRRAPDRLRRIDQYITARFACAGPIDRPVWGRARRLCCGALLAAGV